MLFCEKCGNQIEEGSTFCGACGAPVNEPSEQSQATPVAEDVAPVEENIPMDDFSSDEYLGKKKKRGMPIWAKIGLPVVALALVAVIILNISTIWGTLLKWVGSGESYFRFVQSKAIDEMSENFVDNYYSAIKGETNEVKTTVSMGMTVDESLGGTIGLDSEVLDVINDAEFVATLNSKSEKIGADVALNLSNKEVLSLETIIDAGSESIYFTVPEIIDSYMKAELDTSDMDVSFDILNEAFATLPEDDDMQELITKYTNIVFECVEEVDKDSYTIKIEGVEQNCTSLSFELTDELATDMAKAVLKEAQDDETIKAVIKDMEKALDTDEDAYGAFSDAIDEALDELGDYEAEDITLAEITEFVNSSHEIIGFEIEAEDQTVFFATAVDGDEVAAEINFFNEVILAGKGSVEDDLLSGKFALETSGKELVELKISNYDVKLAEKGKFAGNIKLSLTEDGIDMLDSEAASVFKLLNPVIELDVKHPEDNKCEIKLNLLGSSDTILLGFNVTVVNSDKADNISVPKDAVDVNDDEAMAELAESIDLNKILEKLEDAGIPDEIYDLISEMLVPSYPSYDTYSDYIYDDYSDYYDDYSDYEDVYDFSETDEYDTW